MNQILAIDIGTHLGWAIGTGQMLNAPCISGTEHFKVDRYSGGGMRFLKFKRWLTQIHTIDGFDEVCFEEVRRHLSTDSAHVYGGFLSVLTSCCEEWKVPYVGIPVATIKKFATGKGNADKKQMIAAVKSWGFLPCDDNEADAIAILKCHFSTI